MILSRRCILIIVFSAVCLLVSSENPVRGAGLFDGTGGANAKLGPGKEVQVRDPDVGGRRYYTVYLPSDYDGHHPFPIIFTYHGKNEEPRTWPFTAITGGKGFIIIGMEYPPEAAPKLPNSGDPRQPEVDVLRRIAARLRSELKLDPKCMFVGGVGQGAIEAQVIATRSPELWEGLVIFRSADAKEDAPPKALTGKPILIALPESDPLMSAAKEAAENYQRSGADVTFKPLASAKNELATSDPSLKQWLITYGPQRRIRTAVAAGQAAEKANKPGEAFLQYDSVANLDATTDEAKVARQGAQRLADRANTMLAAAERSISTKDSGAAATVLLELSSTYAGSEFGQRAADRLKSIASDPAVVKVLAQAKVDGQADTLEAQGAALEHAQNYLKAITTYETYLTKYPKAHHVEAVRTKLAALRSNKAVQATQVDTDCRSWLSLADNFIRSGYPEKARPQLQKIIDTYGQTPWAEQARERLKHLDGGM